MENQDLKQKKMKVILLKGGLKYLEDVRDLIEAKIESIESNINELLDEIRQQEGESE